MNREEKLKIAKPILFNTEMVKAILEGRKTVTRRVVKPQPTGMLKCVIEHECDGGAYWSDDNNILTDTTLYKIFEIGDILYVRETFGKDKHGQYHYRADYPEHDCEPYPIWHPSIHMPKEAARIFLKVTDVRFERLQEITDKQAKFEGVEPITDALDNVYVQDDCSIGHILAFNDLWNSTINKQDLDKYGWEGNPWVWVIVFERGDI